MAAFKLALVTGASSGIGEALAHLLADQNIALLLTGRNGEKLRQLTFLLQKKVPVEYVLAELANPDERQLVAKLIAEKRPDLIINNAGFGVYGDAIACSLQEQSELLEVNVKALTELSLIAAKTLFQANEQGVILNVSSVAAYFTFPCFSVYASSKAYVNHFSKSLDCEMKRYGIRVLAACPGVVKTAFRSRAAKDLSKQTAASDSIGVMGAKFAASQIWNQILQSKRVHIFNWRYRLAAFLSKCLPDFIITPLLRKGIESYCPPEKLLNRR